MIELAEYLWQIYPPLKEILPDAVGETRRDAHQAPCE